MQVAAAAVASRMLVTDLDGTLLGDPAATRHLLDWLAPRRAITRLVYNTGRAHTSAAALIAAEELPWPDALVTGVGTAIVYGPGQSPDPAWTSAIVRRWNLRAVRAAAALLGDALAWQEPAAQTALKASFLVRDPAAPGQLAALLAASPPWVRLLVSEGQLLDAIPARAGKQAAVRYLQQAFGLAPAMTLVCGDAENDLDMLAGGAPAIAVGNACPALRALGEAGGCYLARAAHAAGILEGLAHFGWR